MELRRDLLGKLEPKACVSVFGALYGQPNTGGYHAFQTTSDAPEKGMKWDYTSKDVTAIVEEMQLAGYSCEVKIGGSGAPTIFLTHTETEKEIEKLKNNRESVFFGAEKGFVRFGNIPKNGLSKNNRDKVFEAGVSVFEAEFAKNGEFRVVGLDAVLENTFNFVCDRDVYRCYGKVLGTGADGEPVISVQKAVKL